MSKHIDLNCDMGESFGAWTMGADAAVMPWITSANIACGGHAGDPLTMQRTVAAAVASEVAIGAHIGLPDKLGFGRRAMAISVDELYALVQAQLGALIAIAAGQGVAVGHLKPHGALYHMLESDEALAEAVVDAARAVAPAIRMVGLAGGQLVTLAHEAGLAVLHEAFVDRRYLADGSLAPRQRDDAVITHPDEGLAQAVRLVRDGSVTTVDGSAIKITADTLCIHGDRPDAADFARVIHQGLHAAGVTLQSP